MALSWKSTARFIAGENKNLYISAFTRWTHSVSQPLQNAVTPSPAFPPLVLPQFQKPTNPIYNGIGSGFHVGIGSMDLMAVPKKKTSPHKRGIRNGPKALKPIPVIIRCKACGQVKLPHFYCCSGIRDTDGPNDSTN